MGEQAEKQKRFKIAYRQGAPMIYAKALRLLCRAEDAEEALQEVTMKWFQAFSDYEHADKPTAWLYRVTTNTCLNILRTESRKTPKNRTSPDDLAGGGVNVVDRLYFQQALKCLPEKLQPIFIYHFVDGMTQEEIAEVTLQARITVARALKSIVEILKKKHELPTG